MCVRAPAAFGAYFGLAVALVYGRITSGHVRKMPDMAGARTTSDLTAMIGALLRLLHTPVPRTGVYCIAL